MSEFDARGVRVIGISVDPPGINREHRRRMGFTFPLLSDVRSETIHAWDLDHPGGGPGHADISRPAEFLVDARGIVRWVNLTDSIVVRARPDQALAAIDRLDPAS